MTDLPIQKDIRDALQINMWLLREAMANDPVTYDHQGEPIIPAHFYLPILKKAVAAWNEALIEAKDEVPYRLHHKLKMANMHAATGTEEVARTEPEVRRYYLLDLIHNLMKQAVEMLESEGKPPLPAPNLKLGKMRR